MDLDNFDLDDDLGGLEDFNDWGNLPGADGGATGQVFNSSTDSILNTFGDANVNVVDEVTSAVQVRVDRERSGQCADCGAQTHEVQLDASGQVVKVPLSVPGEVHRGRCLFCHPLPNSNRRDPHISSSGSVCTVSSQQSTAAQSQYSQHSAPAQWGQSPYQQRRNANDLAPDYVQQMHFQRNQHLLQQHNQHPDEGSVFSNPSAYSTPSHASSHASRLYPDTLSQAQSYQTADGSVYSNVSQHTNQFQQQQQQQQQQYPDDGSVASHHSGVSQQSQQSYHSQASYHSYNQQFMSPQQAHGIDRTNSSASIQSNNPDYNKALELALRSMQDDNLSFEHVIRAMQHFPGNAVVQERGCTILWNQTFNAEVCHMLVTMGGVATILRAMRGHPTISKLQHTALEVLRNLCVNELNRQSLLQSGGLPFVVETMQKLAEDAEIQRSGCNMLASVAQGGMEYKIAVAECGGILAVMKAVETHPDNDNVLRAAYQTLRLLGYNPGGSGGGGN